jgi:2-dehydro-3-deoxyglucarate aldolase/4-hydroxy-2-oxoheptanedioate aldolase
MQNAPKVREKLRQGKVCLGTGVACTDPAMTEALCSLVDFFWIDTEHGPLSLDTVEAHIRAAHGGDAAAVVRVPWNDPVRIKPVLDLGADGVIVPMVQNAEDVRQAVAACRYPPEGIRGYGPRRPSQYGRLGGPEFCRLANETILIFVQIENGEAVRNLEEILAVPGLTGILIGPNDLAGSLGYTGQPDHPEVLRVIDEVVDKARESGVVLSVAIRREPEEWAAWVKRGVRWITFGGDLDFILGSADYAAGRVREHLARAAAR